MSPGGGDTGGDDAGAGGDLSVVLYEKNIKYDFKNMRRRLPMDAHTTKGPYNYYHVNEVC
jgi:hypothetical protein